MPRPQVVVTVSTVLPRRGTSSPTGTAFMVFASATGIANTLSPRRLRTREQAVAAFGAAGPILDWVADALSQGAAEVVVVKAVAATPTAVTLPEWTAALDTLGVDFGAGQVLIPGVSTTAAHDALLAHTAKTGRVVLLDGAVDATAAALTTIATAQAAKTSSDRATLLAGWPQVPGPGGSTRSVPPSVMVAGLIARGDTRVGHANHAPAGLHSGGAGVVLGATGVALAYTDAQADTLYDAGVNLVAATPSGVLLTGFASLSTDARLGQLNTARILMEITLASGAILQRYLQRQIDSKGLLYAEVEGELRGYLLGLYERNALYGADPDAAFDVLVNAVNSPADAAAGRLRASCVLTVTQHVEAITLDVTAQLPGEAA